MILDRVFQFLDRLKAQLDGKDCATYIADRVLNEHYPLNEDLIGKTALALDESSLI